MGARPRATVVAESFLKGDVPLGRLGWPGTVFLFPLIMNFPTREGDAQLP
ncbi:hypothetical protein [Dermatophilus congolensis]|nr:hypothetical protein [Dermatophilus congolensis]